jgi:hypothetical protein
LELLVSHAFTTVARARTSSQIVQHVIVVLWQGEGLIDHPFLVSQYILFLKIVKTRLKWLKNRF